MAEINDTFQIADYSRQAPETNVYLTDLSAYIAAIIFILSLIATIAQLCSGKRHKQDLRAIREQNTRFLDYIDSGPPIRDEESEDGGDCPV